MTPDPNTLLPCPFCGSETVTIYNDGVWCEVCSAHHDIESSDGGRDAAIAAWNRRDNAQSLAARDGWLPIETAPKDGTIYLCWVDAIRYGESDDGSLYQADVSEVDFGQWRDFETGGAHFNMMGDIGDGQKITHWRPLPEPPTQPHQEARDG